MTQSAGRFLRHFRDLALHGRGMQLVNGNALAARLVRSALDLGVELRTEAPAWDAPPDEGFRLPGLKQLEGVA